MSVSFFLSNIAPSVSLAGYSFTAQACAGLVIGTFELAFERTYNQVMFRMLLHLVCIPLGVYLLSLDTLLPTSNVYSQSKALLSCCIFMVGCIGMLIGIVEIGLIPMSSKLFNRLLIYLACTVLSLPFLPVVASQKEQQKN